MKASSRIRAALSLLLAGFGAVAASAAQVTAIPKLSELGYGWWEIGDDFLKPPSGPGPVMSDPTHPYVPNNTTAQPTYRVADLNNPILKPWVVENLKKRNAWVLSGKVPFQARERCWPAGVPGFEVFTQQRPIYFVQGAKDVLIVNEGDAQVRRVYLNVPHSANVKPSWYGESVGHYENGDTLVVDTIGLNDKTYVDNYLTPHTAELHVVERFKVTEGGKTLEVSVTVEDPGAFNTAWSAIQIYHWRYQGPWDDAICAENNDNYFHYEMAPIPQARNPDF